ncbi:MAG TPA: hypothetical protein VIM65_09360, partial [Cyclobacteriaceae bacterium]
MRNRLLVYAFLLSGGLSVALVSCSKFDTFDDKYFVKYYGEDGDQVAVDMVSNTDGSIVLLGKTSAGDNRILLIKVGSKGNVMWQKKLGSDTDDPKDIEPLANGNGFVILSDYEESAGNTDVKLIQISSDGNVVNTSTHGSSSNDHSKTVTLLNDGGFIIAGYSEFDWRPSDNVNRMTSIFHYRCDSDLTFRSNWPENFGSGIYNAATKVIQSGDSIYVFGVTDAGSSQNPNNKRVIIYYSVGETGPKDAVNYLGETNSDTDMACALKTPEEIIEGYFLVSTTDLQSAPRLRLSKLKDPLRFNNTDDIQFDKTVNEGTFATRNIVGVSASSSLIAPQG